MSQLLTRISAKYFAPAPNSQFTFSACITRKTKLLSYDQQTQEPHGGAEGMSPATCDPRPVYAETAYVSLQDGYHARKTQITREKKRG